MALSLNQKSIFLKLTFFKKFEITNRKDEGGVANEAGNS